MGVFVLSFFSMSGMFSGDEEYNIYFISVGGVVGRKIVEKLGKALEMLGNLGNIPMWKSFFFVHRFPQAQNRSFFSTGLVVWVLFELWKTSGKMLIIKV